MQACAMPCQFVLSPIRMVSAEVYKNVVWEFESLVFLARMEMCDEHGRFTQNLHYVHSLILSDPLTSCDVQI